MGGKYEVYYWDYNQGKEISKGYTNSIFKAWRLIHKLEKQWYCVGLRFRRDKVKKS